MRKHPLSSVVLLAAAARAAESAAAADNCTSDFWQRPTRLRLALVRHGESLNNVHEAVSEAAYHAHRQADPDLSPRGFKQAQLLGAFLGDAVRSRFLDVHPIDELWVSPVKRTLQTMAPAAEALGMAPRVKTDCFEAGGIYDADPTYTSFTPRGGLARDEMRALFPTYELPETVTSAGWYTGAGKETDDECRARCARVADELRATARALDADRNVVLVAHYDFICALLDALVVPERAHRGPFLGWKHYNTGITVLDITAAGQVTVFVLNAVAHLLHEDALVSGF